MAIPLPKRRFTVADYYRMAEAGILGPEDRVELIEGEVVEMAPIGSRHAGWSRHPGPADTLLVVEVADMSAETDRAVKGALYARAGIPEFWLVDLESDAIEIYREPEPAGWRERRFAHPGERIAPTTFPAAELQVSKVLGV